MAQHMCAILTSLGRLLQRRVRRQRTLITLAFPCAFIVIGLQPEPEALRSGVGGSAQRAHP